MLRTIVPVAFLALAALAAPSALAFPVFDVVEGAYDETAAWYDETFTNEPQEEAPASEADPEPAQAEAEPAPEEEPSSGLTLRVGLGGVAEVSAPLPVDAPVVPQVLDALPVAMPDVLQLVDEVAPAPAPARAPAAAPASSEPAPTFVPVIVPPEPTVAAGVVAAGAASAAAAAGAASTGATLWERMRRFAWAALLYSRIAKERLLDHGARERLLAAIRARPGLAVADLAEATGIPRNTATYHLRVMERESLVSSQREGRNRLYFAPGSLQQRDNADALATLRHETTLRMAQAIGASPGVDQKALCAVVGVSPSLAHWHADRLVASGVVDKRREGRFVRYYPGTAFTVVASRS